MRSSPGRGACRLASAALVVACAAACDAGGGLGDFRTLIGVARGSGEVSLSPARGIKLDSRASSDVAFAMTAAPLPSAYTVTAAVTNVDIDLSGCRFGLFGEQARLGGTNAAINDVARYVVSFHVVRGEHLLYLTWYDPEGAYYCWDGSAWRKGSWVASGARWQPATAYEVSIGKGASEYTCRVSQDGSPLLEVAGPPVTAVRGCGEPEYFAFGDMVTDYVKGTIQVSSVTIEETLMDPHIEQDMTHAVIRQAPEGRYAMYGGLTKLPDGEVFCTFKVGSVDAKGNPWTVRDETIVWTRSTNQGRAWPGTENLIYRDGTTRQENCCGRGYLCRDGAVIHPFYILNPDYEERAQEQNWAKLMLARTPDQGETWHIEQLKTPIELGVSFGGFVRLRDGTALLNCYGAAKRGTFRHEAWVMRSADDGVTWGDPSPIGPTADPDGGPARLNETDVAELPDGTLVSLSRTQYSDYPLWQGFSEDRGRTWAAGPSGLHGLCPSLLFTDTGPPEGTLITAYHDRYLEHANKGGMYLAFSQDGGRHWGHPTWFSSGAYPCMVQLDDGSALCSYYASTRLLRATTFRAPFPSGLRARPGTAAGDGVTVEWDAYAGAKMEQYSYQVHRSADPAFAPSPDTLIATLARVPIYEDTAATAGLLHYYRIVALEDATEVGRSWVAVARAGRG